MPTTSLPRRAGARTAALAALTLAATAAGAPAFAQPGGDNGDVKIHKVGTPFDDQRNQPKVCDFYLAAFNFDAGERVTWTIKTQPPVPGGPQLPNSKYPNNVVIIESDGMAQTIPLELPDGQYKLTWKTDKGHGAGKHKVFKVDCPISKPTAPPGPNGGPPAGGGGLARDDAFGPVAGAAAVGLAAVTGVVWFRVRRRAHGA
ncbi:putative secreted protein [Streptomyces davaonensis JCM 4913]|uniref:Putative secreted protein n=1 Tax=Streptomyces davaonensis (strain DSM 101723 / JCM 4913 / KCC S-0913 / 768) TaxID=1214101 RepID=K4RCV2_STRDJ|nr:hypothetical protein [Streptomyces davaonensis]CCK31237.1 putative secreted protein [Streptomyces davaonensis JCM 4913]